MGKIKFMEVNYKLCHDTIIFHPAYYLNEIREHYNMSKETFATDIAVRSEAFNTRSKASETKAFDTRNKVSNTRSKASNTRNKVSNTRSKASNTRNKVSEKIFKLLNGEIGIDDEIAQCLEDYFDISKEYWLNMQKKYDYDNQKQIYTTMSDTTCT